MKEKEKSFQERILTTEDLYSKPKAKAKKFAAGIITTQSLSDDQIHSALEGKKLEPIVTTKDVDTGRTKPAAVTENEEEKNETGKD